MNQQLNPTNPNDALVIIHSMTRKMSTTQEGAELFSACMSTLRNFVIQHEKKEDKPKENPETKKTKRNTRRVTTKNTKPLQKVEEKEADK